MNSLKNYIHALCLSVLFQSSIFTMAPTGVRVPVVPSSWVAQGFYNAQPIQQPMQVPQINPEMLARAQEELMQEQQTQPAWSTQKMRPAYVVQKPSYDSLMLQPEQKSSKLAGRGGFQSGILRPTPIRFMSRQEAAKALGVSENASDKDIKVAYRKAAQKAHPDAGGSDLQMKRINEARDILLRKIPSSEDKGNYNWNFYNYNQPKTEFEKNIGYAVSLVEAEDKRQKSLNNILLYSAQKGDRSTVEEALNQGAYPDGNLEVLDGNPLLEALYNNHPDIAMLLLAAGAEVNVKGKRSYDNTPLQEAISKGYTDIAKLLLAAGAEVNVKGKRSYDNTPLQEAVTKGYTDIVKDLIAAGAEVNVKGGLLLDTPLQEAINKGHADIAKLLIAAGADVNVKSGLFKVTPLQEAIEKGYADIAKLLIAAGADVNVADRLFKKTPLHYAVENEQIDIIKDLIAAGADIEATDSFNFTPLSKAMIKNNPEIMKIFGKAYIKKWFY